MGPRVSTEEEGCGPSLPRSGRPWRKAASAAALPGWAWREPAGSPCEEGAETRSWPLGRGCTPSRDRSRDLWGRELCSLLVSEPPSRWVCLLSAMASGGGLAGVEPQGGGVGRGQEAPWGVWAAPSGGRGCRPGAHPTAPLAGVSAQSFHHCFTLASTAFNLQVATPGVSAATTPRPPPPPRPDLFLEQGPEQAVAPGTSGKPAAAVTPGDWLARRGQDPTSISKFRAQRWPGRRAHVGRCLHRRARESVQPAGGAGPGVTAAASHFCRFARFQRPPWGGGQSPLL